MPRKFNLPVLAGINLHWQSKLSSPRTPPNAITLETTAMLVVAS